MSLFVLVLSLALAGIALLHLLWGLRIWWPIRDEFRLARTVVGASNIRQMPGSSACFNVALALFGAAALPWLLQDRTAFPGWIATLLTLAGIGLALVFLVRGGAGYTRRFAALFPEEPFRSLDQRLYSPLCLVLGAGFSLLTFWSF